MKRFMTDYKGYTGTDLAPLSDDLKWHMMLCVTAMVIF